MTKALGSACHTSTDIALGTRGGKDVEKGRTHLFHKGLRAVVYPRDEPALLPFIHPRNTGPAQMLHELGDGLRVTRRVAFMWRWFLFWMNSW